MNKTRIIAITAVVFIAAATRLLPHPPNFTPIASMALFGGAFFGKKYLGLLLPLLAMFVSDLFLGFHATMWAVYLSFVLTVLLGFGLKSNMTVSKVLGGAVGSAILFFVITNFGVWISYDFYPKTIAGLMECYIAAVPFFNNSILSNLLFTGVLFGGFYFASTKIPQLATIKIKK